MKVIQKEWLILKMKYDLTPPKYNICYAKIEGSEKEGDIAGPNASSSAPFMILQYIWAKNISCQTYDGERQVTKPSFPLQSCRSRTEFL